MRKNIKVIFLLMILSLILSGCFGPGLSDFGYNLTGKYSLSYAGGAVIGDDKYNVVIDRNITKIAWDDDFIYAIQEKDGDGNYWIIDVNSNKLYDPMNEDEFNQCIKELNINSKINFKDPKKYRHLESAN